ncbi:MAG TPA: hypothetical protein VGT98_11400, partial [Candidatus Elarobacter sp.]|nr:hypothetical protein [Candidatus Elarobacter sp.]
KMSEPPAPPLDEMWANIEPRAFGVVPVLPFRPRQAPRWRAPALAAAAALVVGVGLGWYAAPRGRSVAPGVASPATNVARNPAVTTSTLPEPSDATSGTAESETPRTLASGSRDGRDSRSISLRGDADAMRFVPHLDVGARGDMSRYLAQTAALLASLPQDKGSAASDSAVATRAGELLTQTHLLLDSQAGSDPTLHKLLEDLELVLAQVARLRATPNGADLQLIRQALTVHDVLPRVYDATVEAGTTD